ncbi:MAG: MgtC/SapB family protein [Alsobacter sp.]
MSGPWLNFMVALALGLLIGIERERRKGEGPARGAAGLRTFGLAALLGAVAVHAGGPLALFAALAGVALLAALAYHRDRGDDPGLTTEVALLSTPLVGALAMSDIILAGLVGVMIAVVLASKTAVHRFVKGTLTDAEVSDGIVFAIATVIVWPQLPDRPMGPYGALNPHALWLFVILVLAIGAIGHVLTRVIGPRFGLPLAGFASGFVSSTATIGTMGSLATRNPNDLAAAVAGATLSTVSTFAQLSLLLAVASRPTLAALALPLIAGGVVALGYGIVFTVWAVRSQDAESSAVGKAFSVKAALSLAATLAVMMVVTAWLRTNFGETGMVLGSAIGGLIDTHAAALSVGSLVASGSMAPADSVLPILAAMTTNAFSKAAMAMGTGEQAFIARVLPGLGMSLATAWLAALPALGVL